MYTSWERCTCFVGPGPKSHVFYGFGSHCPSCFNHRVILCQHAVVHLLSLHAGRDRMNNEYDIPQEALWTFDIKSLTWQERHPSGPLPDPSLACGMAIVTDQLYLLVNDIETPSEHYMKVYQLDLHCWHWRLLQCEDQAPPAATHLTPVRVEVCSLTMCGTVAVSFLLQKHTSSAHSCCASADLRLQFCYTSGLTTVCHFTCCIAQSTVKDFEVQK